MPSGKTNFHGVTGGVYKARERIHRDLLIRDYEQFQLRVLELQRTVRTEATFWDPLVFAHLLPSVIAIVVRV